MAMEHLSKRCSYPANICMLLAASSRVSTGVKYATNEEDYAKEEYTLIRIESRIR